MVPYKNQDKANNQLVGQGLQCHWRTMGHFDIEIFPKPFISGAELWDLFGQMFVDK
jgi:hypothetical protein